MSSLPPLSASDFSAYFSTVHGSSPFPWQDRLARQVAADQPWPSVLDLPTGSGKTAVIDVAVFQLALQAGRLERSAALRIVYVVDRRTIVDQAYERAKKLVTALDAAKDGVLAVVRDRLKVYSRDSHPLRAALLRGAIARNDDWARSPDQPLIAVSTVDQVGSRLLFRGYGVSDSMKPVHAGLLGNDVLYLLDEVHLSQPFRETLAAINGRYRRWAEAPLANPFHVMEMSATPGCKSESAFGLHEDDRIHSSLSRRLNAKKQAALITTTGRGFATEVEKAVKPMVERPGATVAVVVNRVASARALHSRLSSSLNVADVHLVTGRMRPLDRDVLERRILVRVRSGRVRDQNQRPVVVVATQCIEAGADFDFDGLVTECASLDALRQRFGRVDRLGEMCGEARGVVLACKEAFNDDPVYGDAIGATWAWLQQQASDDGVVDFGIHGLEVPADAADRGLLAPRASAPVLLPRHLDAWVQTFPRPSADPDISLWLHGPGRGVADVQVIWRTDLAHELLAATQEANASRTAEARAVGMVESLAPSSGEAMSVPFDAVRKWLEGRPEPDVFDVEGSRAPSLDGWTRRNEIESATRLAVLWRGDESRVIEPAAIRPGDTLVLPSAYGGVDNGTWSPVAAEPVSDLAEFAALRQRGRAVLRLHPDVIRGLLGEHHLVPIPGLLDSEQLDDLAMVHDWLAGVEVSELPDETAHLITLLREDRKGIRVERLPMGADETAGEYFVVTGRSRLSFDGSEVSTEDDRASFTGVKVYLTDHLGGVRDTAGQLAERVGMPRSVVDDLRLSGRWHDVGKIDPRMQKLLHGGSEYKAAVETEPLAKSAVVLTDPRARRRAIERSDYPPGTRHELMSVALMESAASELSGRANDWDLVLHLVGSHHGRCRPLAPWTPDHRPTEMHWALDDIEVRGISAHSLSRLDSEVADRFWCLVQRYGWWGLAWLEAVLRLGDHRRSQDEQRRVAQA